MDVSSSMPVTSGLGWIPPLTRTRNPDPYGKKQYAVELSPPGTSGSSTWEQAYMLDLSKPSFMPPSFIRGRKIDFSENPIIYRRMQAYDNAIKDTGDTDKKTIMRKHYLRYKDLYSRTQTSVFASA